MAHYILDIETDNLLDKMTTVHMICLRDLETDEVLVYHDDLHLERTFHMGEAESKIRQADSIIGHNLIGFDMPALEKQFGWTFPNVKMWDTLILSRLHYADIGRQMDWPKINRGGTMPRKLANRHSLEAWGHRLKENKGDFSDYETLTQEMIDYCIQDTKVTRLLYQLFERTNLPRSTWELEHEFARNIQAMCDRGVAFDEAKAEALYVKLIAEREKLDKQLIGCFEPRVIVSYTKVKRIRKEKIQVFNPNSDQQVAWHLTNKYGWKPKVFTDGGKASVTDKVLKGLTYPEAPVLARRSMISKRISTIAEGKNPLLKLVKDGRIHGSVMHIGCHTHRCSHARPNLGNQTSVRKEYGPEIRELFTTAPGHRLVGVDVSGLELRMLAHYLYRWDGGTYVEQILNGDIHSYNMRALGLTDRDKAKTFIYAFLYGAGDAKLGSIVGGGVGAGRKLKALFFKGIVGLKHLQTKCKEKHRNQGYVLGPDGRHIPTRSEHSSLNTLLQGSGAVVVKVATNFFIKWMDEQPAPDWGGMVLHVHDEWQSEVETSHLQDALHFAPRSIEKAGQFLKLKCPMTGEAKDGRTWIDTH